MNKMWKTHLMAIFCIIIWGCTLISQKVLIACMPPLELMFWRFFIGYLTLWIIQPKFLKMKKKEEWICALCGLTGVTLYFWCQNLALTVTTASHVSVIVCVSPMFTAILTWLLYRKEKLHVTFVIGFMISIAGIVMVVFTGDETKSGNMMGDLLVAGAAIAWAVYSVAIRKLENYPSLLVIRKCFFYGLLVMIPIFIGSGTTIHSKEIASFTILPHLLYMGIFASAICYGIWDNCFRILGAVKTNAYLYALPVVTILFSTIFLKERLTEVSMIGVLFTVGGLFLSEIQKKEKQVRDSQ